MIPLFVTLSAASVTFAAEWPKGCSLVLHNRQRASLRLFDVVRGISPSELVERADVLFLEHLAKGFSTRYVPSATRHSNHPYQFANCEAEKK